jgi:hypothetical protein
MASDSSSVVLHDGQKLICLDRNTGKLRWEAEDTVLELPVKSSTGPRVLIYEDMVLLVANDGKVSGWTLAEGTRVWEQPQMPSGHMSLKDLIVVDGLSWTASIAGSSNDGVWIGYDPKTGERRRRFASNVQLHWFHHRCYPAKACGKYIITGRNGTEYVDLRKERWTPNHWVRGGCIYGVMPCNGMTYAPMDACGCQLEAKLSGFKALSSADAPVPTPEQLAPEYRLQRGPAYGLTRGPAAGPDDWPTYRHDPARSGSSPKGLSDTGDRWDAKLGGKLTQPTIAGGRVFVASRDTHTVYALDLESGRQLWSYTTGGQTDTPPSYVRRCRRRAGLAVSCGARGPADDGLGKYRICLAGARQRSRARERTGAGNRVLHGRSQHLSGWRYPLFAVGSGHREIAGGSRVG